MDAANRLLDDGTYAYSYDANGNLTQKTNKTTAETTAYSYDAEDRLISVNNNIAYSYDPLGRRIQKNVNGVITKYIYDNEDIIREYDGNNSLTASYTHGPSIDEPLILEKAGQKYYYHTDALGSVTTITDSNNNVVQSYTYDSFGNIANQTGSLTQPYTYTGREYDPETGLYYYRARYYDSKIGRFLQEDPIWDVNLYGYCLNNPINWIDPLGTDIWIGMGTGPFSQFHENISVGSPIGSSDSYTYGTTYTITSQYGITGKVMKDSQQTVPESFTDYYLTTTPEQDKEARDILDQMKEGDIKGPYRFTNPSCRNFSRDMYDYFKNKFSQENQNRQSSKKEESCK